MSQSVSDDSVMAETATPRLRFRSDRHKVFAEARGYVTVTDQAKWHGIDRPGFHDLLSGRTVPRLDRAMKIAKNCGCPIEYLWEEVA